MVGFIGFSSPDKSVITPMSITVIHTRLLNFFFVSNPANVTKPIGLPTYSLSVMIFISPFGEYDHNLTTTYRLSGLLNSW